MLSSRALLTSTLALILLGAASLPAWAAAPAADAPVAAGSATIVVIGNKGVSKTYLVSGAKEMAALEKMFPQYQKRPTATTSGGWRAGYLVYFDFPNGESVRLVVTPPDHAQAYWSMGRGDFPVQGDLAKFLAELPE